MKPLTLVVRALVRVYQYSLSSVMAPSCRYHPSCSQYAYEALGRHGPIRGSWLAAGRVLRCQPWGGQGYDPVPPASETADRSAVGRDARAR